MYSLSVTLLDLLVFLFLIFLLAHKILRHQTLSAIIELHTGGHSSGHVLMEKGLMLLFDKYRLNLLIILAITYTPENNTIQNAFAKLRLLILISIKADILCSLNSITD